MANFLQSSNSLGGRVAQVRNESGLSRRELAIGVGVSPETIRKIESGETRSPRADLLERIANSLNVSLMYLLHGQERTSNSIIIRQVREHIYEVELPSMFTLDVQTQEELTRRLSFELELITQRKKVLPKRGG